MFFPLMVLQQQQTAPGALFEDKPHSANDAWRKLHSDPLLMIRQREQEALARIKNNPIKMAMIKNSVSFLFRAFVIYPLIGSTLTELLEDLIALKT